MTDQTDMTQLTGDYLLELMVAGERRNRQRRRGETDELAPYAPCPVCRQPVAEQAVTLGTADEDDRVLTVRPCGHRAVYNLKVAQQMVLKAQQIVDAEEQTAMSVWGTILDLENGEDGPPYVYQGSHILPSDTDPRDGIVQLAEVPSHITRDGRDDRPEDGAPWPWMRLSVDQVDKVLHARQVREIWESMGAWLEQVEGRG